MDPIKVEEDKISSGEKRLEEIKKELRASGLTVEEHKRLLEEETFLRQCIPLWLQERLAGALAAHAHAPVVCTAETG